jgi:multimeric flavodoxin WrbA
MNILVLLGSPRKNGNSETLVKTVIEGIEEKILCTVESIYLHGLKDFHPCRGCGGCEKTGMCVIKDDMIALYEKVDEADIIFLVTPVYFYGPSAQIKIFIDRFQARWSRKYLLKQRIRIDDNRKGYLLATAATKGPKVFDACELIAKSYFDTIDVEYGGEFVVRSVDEKKALSNTTTELEKAQQFGRDIAESFD